MRSMFVPLRLATNARGLELVTELDPAIDQVRLRFILLRLVITVSNLFFLIG